MGWGFSECSLMQERSWVLPDQGEVASSLWSAVKSVSSHGGIWVMSPSDGATSLYIRFPQTKTNSALYLKSF